MPTLAIILLIYYGACLLYDVARGPRTLRFEGFTAVLPLITGTLTITAWLSLPFCGAVPALAWVAVGLIGFGMLCAVGMIGRSIEIDTGTLVIEALIFAFYAVALLTFGWCPA